MVLSAGLAAGAQQQTPTIPKPTPNLSELRRRLQQNLDKRKAGGAEASKSLKDKRSQPDTGRPAGEPSKAPPPPRQPARTQRTPVSRVTGGTSGTGASTRIVGSTGAGAGAGAGTAAIRTLGGDKYEPVKQREIEYKPVPDMGESMTLNGPLGTGEFLDTLALATNWNVLVTPDAKAVNLEFWITEVKPREALEILRFHDVYYEYKEDTKYLYVMTKDEHLTKEFGKLEEHEFVVEHAEVDYIESVVSSLLSPEGRIITDPRTRHLYVWDTKDNVAKMIETVAELDVPLDEAEFFVKHADVADIEAVLTSMLSGSGTIITDPRTGSLLVKDLRDNIDRMQVTLDKFDVPLESRVFEIRYIDADALVESIEELLTERGMAQVDPRSNAIIVTDIPSRQDQIAEIIETLDIKLETRTWVLSYVEPDLIAERVETLVPEEMGDIVVDEDVHQLTVTALPERLEDIEELITRWDIMRRQVQIQAYLVTLNDNLARSLNVSWSYLDSTGNTPQAYRIGGGATPDFANLANTVTVGQLPYAEPLRSWFSGDVITNINDQEVIRKFHGNRVAAVLDYLDTKGKATVISSPSVTVQDGEEAAFQSGRKVPYVTSTSYGAGYRSYDQTQPNQNYNYYARPYNRIDFIEVGTILRVLPRIADDDTILLDIIAEDSDATNVQVISSGEENTIPEKTESKAETMVRVADGQTIVVGGLRKGNASVNVSKSIPILSDIPVLGRLFRNPSRQIDNNTLMIFITTSIVDETTPPEAERLAMVDEDFAQQFRRAKKSSLELLFDNVRRNKNEIGVSIGQSGHMHSGGRQVTIDELRQKFRDVRSPSMTKVFIRKHPRAPDKVVTELMEIILEFGLKVEFDTDIVPFVPNYGPDESAQGPAAADDQQEAPSRAG